MTPDVQDPTPEDEPNERFADEMVFDVVDKGEEVEIEPSPIDDLLTQLEEDVVEE